MKKITLKYIAKELNIAVKEGEVSDLCEFKPKAILDLAKSLNFSPNTQAAFLRTRESKIIGIFI